MACMLLMNRFVTVYPRIMAVCESSLQCSVVVVATIKDCSVHWYDPRDAPREAMNDKSHQSIPPCHPTASSYPQSPEHSKPPSP